MPQTLESLEESEACDTEGNHNKTDQKKKKKKKKKKKHQSKTQVNSLLNFHYKSLTEKR